MRLGDLAEGLSVFRDSDLAAHWGLFASLGILGVDFLVLRDYKGALACNVQVTCCSKQLWGLALLRVLNSSEWGHAQNIAVSKVKFIQWFSYDCVIVVVIMVMIVVMRSSVYRVPCWDVSISELTGFGVLHLEACFGFSASSSHHWAVIIVCAFFSCTALFKVWGCLVGLH